MTPESQLPADVAAAGDQIAELLEHADATSNGGVYWSDTNYVAMANAVLPLLTAAQDGARARVAAIEECLAIFNDYFCVEEGGMPEVLRCDAAMRALLPPEEAGPR